MGVIFIYLILKMKHRLTTTTRISIAFNFKLFVCMTASSQIFLSGNYTTNNIIFVTQNISIYCEILVMCSSLQLICTNKMNVENTN